MADIKKLLSPFIQGQFPNHYLQRPGVEVTESERAVIVDFMEAFYEYLETTANSSLYNSRRMFEYRDIDTTLQEFVTYFKKKYLNELPFIYATDTRFVVKNIIDMYRVKGSEKALKLLIRLLFNEDISVYYPSVDILRVSDSVWKEPRYIELSRSTRTKDFIGTVITGANSGTSAFVQGLVTKRVNQKLIDVLYLSDISGGDFELNELITNDGTIRNSPKIIGSLNDVTQISGIRPNYAIGDILQVVSPDGKEALARVIAIRGSNDNVTFDLKEGGYGYNTTDTEIYISEAVLFTINENLEFQEYENVYQELAQIDTANTLLANTQLGDVVQGFDSLSALVAEGVIVDIKSNNSIVVEQTSNTQFSTQTELNLVDTNIFKLGESVKSEAEATLTVFDATSFSPGEIVLQREDYNGAFVNIAYGVIESTNTAVSNNNTISVIEVFGDFKSGLDIEGKTSGANTTIFSVDYTSSGAVGVILDSTNTSIIINKTSTEDFTANTRIRGESTKTINTIDTIEASGVVEISIANTHTYTTSSVSDVSANGIVVGQTVGLVGLHGNSYPFYVISEATNYINSSETLLRKEITRIGEGTGANFELNSFVQGTQETVSINTDLIGEENIAGVKYTDINIENANNSGVGKLSANVTITDGGSGYSNTSTITFTGGGYNNGTPLIAAEGEIVADANGAITDITITDAGYGYYSEPEITISDGAGANVSVQIITGYGFPKDPYGDYFSVIDDVLSTRQMTIGEIETISRVNPGTGYDTDVYVKIVNNTIKDFNKKDVLISPSTNVSDLFANGEILVSNSGAEGRITQIESNTLYVKMLSFNQDFEIGDTIVGQTTSVESTISSVRNNDKSITGDNAIMSSEVLLLDGTIADVEIIKSGYGYINGESVELYDTENEAVAALGLAVVNKQGLDLGYWETRSSHLNDQFLRDNLFYQEFSYQIISGISLDKYESAVRDVLHVAGTELFGKVEIYSDINSSYTVDSQIDTL